MTLHFFGAFFLVGLIFGDLELTVLVPRRLFFAAQQRIAITWKPN
jgi:hypothetical protein